MTASLILRKLGSYLRQNGLAVALREMGRIERTLFILDWPQSVELRRRVHTGLNKGKARNALAKSSPIRRSPAPTAAIAVAHRMKDETDMERIEGIRESRIQLGNQSSSRQ